LKLLLREFEFYDSGEQAKRAMTTRVQMITATTEAVRLAIANREIVTVDDPTTIGWVIFSIYQAEIRFWLRNEGREIAPGIARLKRSLRVVVNGLSTDHNAQPMTKTPPGGRGAKIRLRTGQKMGKRGVC
jgi:hypothetical protein